MVAVAELISVEVFEAMPEDGRDRLELWRGRVLREPGPAPLHGVVVQRLLRRLTDHIETRELGVVLPFTGFVLSTELANVRVPDIAYVARGRVPEEGAGERMWRMAPDLVVEVVSPSNGAGEVQQKVLDYMDSGVKSVWVVDPRTESVVVWSGFAGIRLLRGNVVLDDAVVPGFRVRLSEIFPH